MKARLLPSQEALKAYFSYDPETGIFQRIGAVCPTKCKREGYLLIQFRYKSWQASRLIWVWMTGKAPNGEVDHINGDRSDNRWSNLRDVSKSLNLYNQHHLRSDNTTGFTGIHYVPRRDKWMVTLGSKFQGYYPTRDAAVEARAQLLIERNLANTHRRTTHA